MGGLTGGQTPAEAAFHHAFVSKKEKEKTTRFIALGSFMYSFRGGKKERIRKGKEERKVNR